MLAFYTNFFSYYIAAIEIVTSFSVLTLLTSREKFMLATTLTSSEVTIPFTIESLSTTTEDTDLITVPVRLIVAALTPVVSVANNNAIELYLIKLIIVPI